MADDPLKALGKAETMELTKIAERVLPDLPAAEQPVVKLSETASLELMRMALALLQAAITNVALAKSLGINPSKPWDGLGHIYDRLVRFYSQRTTL